MIIIATVVAVTAVSLIKFGHFSFRNGNKQFVLNFTKRELFGLFSTNYNLLIGQVYHGFAAVSHIQHVPGESKNFGKSNLF